MKHLYLTIKQSFGLFGMYLVLSLGIGVMFAGFAGSDFLVLISTLAINTLVIVIALQWTNSGFNYLISDNQSIPPLFIAIGCLFSFLVVVILDPFTSLLPMPDWMVEMLEQVVQKNIWSFLAVAIVAPVTEELLFRKIMLTGLARNYGARKAILWSAFFFALFHINPWQGIGAFTIGIFLAWLYLNTQNIWLCIAIHAFNNSLAFLAFYLSDDIMLSMADIVGYNYKLALIVGLSLVSLYFCYKYFDHAFRQNPRNHWNADPDATEQITPFDH